LQLAAAEHRDDAGRLIDCAARCDFGTAFLIAHHIKGTASQIEATTVSACASRAEAKWRRGESVDAAQLEALTSALNGLLAEIDRYLAPPTRRSAIVFSP
jgi:HPt (histidine-containing phosphotransfer) domain-containing protein